MGSEYSFGNVSLIAPVANVLIVPVVPYVMFLGAPALIAGLIWLPLGQWLALGMWLPLTWLGTGALLLAAPRWSAVQLPPLPLWMPIVYYVLVALAHLLRRKHADNDRSANAQNVR